MYIFEADWTNTEVTKDYIHYDNGKCEPLISFTLKSTAWFLKDMLKKEKDKEVTEWWIRADRKFIQSIVDKVEQEEIISDWSTNPC